MADTSWFSRGVIEKLAALRNPPRPGQRSAELHQLTAREHDVLERLCQGDTDDKIAEDLAVSRNTIKNHVASIYKKIGVNRRVAAVNWARERGIGG
jgi:DNA-binding CsgD family transcriptional regulator